MKKYPRYCSYRSKGFFWFRIYGYGLVIKDTTIHPKYFSERNRLIFYIQFGKWLIKPIVKSDFLFENK